MPDIADKRKWCNKKNRAVDKSCSLGKLNVWIRLANQCIAHCIHDIWLHSDTLIVKTNVNIVDLCNDCGHKKYSQLDSFSMMLKSEMGFKRAISEFSTRVFRVWMRILRVSSRIIWPNHPVRISRKTETYYLINTYIEYFTYTNRRIEEFILPNGCYKSVHACNCTYIHKLVCRLCKHQIIRKEKMKREKKNQ